MIAPFRDAVSFGTAPAGKPAASAMKKWPSPDESECLRWITPLGGLCLRGRSRVAPGRDHHISSGPLSASVRLHPL